MERGHAHRSCTRHHIGSGTEMDNGGDPKIVGVSIQSMEGTESCLTQRQKCDHSPIWMDVKIQEYYRNQQTISTRDVQLFTQPLQDLLRARLGTKRRFLEEAASLPIWGFSSDGKKWSTMFESVLQHNSTRIKGPSSTPPSGAIHSLSISSKQSSQLSLPTETRLKNGI